jgi:hypothetical protein
MRYGLVRGVAGTVAAASLLLTACGDGAGASRTCAQPIREPLDPGHLLHIIDPEGARFLTDPPTSGPHTGSAPTGVLDEPIPGAVQVAVLERGDVLVQYRDVDEATLRAVRALAGEHTVVAPNPTLPDPVVVTAWTYKLSCSAFDEAPIKAFIRTHAGRTVAH